MPPRVAFVTSHPIQYQVPVFRHLHASDDVDLEVLFAMLPDATAQGAGFGVAFEWDLPLLEGYHCRVLDNVSRSPGVAHYSGCDTPDIQQVLRDGKFDAVIVNGWVVKTCLQTLRACRRLKIPCIVRGEANHLRPRPWWKKLLQRQLVIRYDAWLPIGTANRNFYASYGVPAERMFSAPYCIENSRFEKAAAEIADQRTNLRSKWGIPEQATCFLFCGKFEPKKHPIELLQSFRDAVAQAGDRTMHLLMVGDGELRRTCEQFVAEHALSSVTFAGFLNQSEIVEAYVASDCLVLPSDHGETWGLVVNEAMACGLPAIVSDEVGCAEDLIRADESGWMFPFGNWSALSQQMGRVAGLTAHFPKIRESCRKHVQQFAPEQAAEGMIQAVRAVAGGQNQRPDTNDQSPTSETVPHARSH